MKWLESELGATILLRTTRNDALTEAGRVFLEETRQALASIERARSLARGAAAGETGRFSAAYMDFAINGPLLAILSAFRAEHPGIRIDLTHMWTEHQRTPVSAGEIDIGFPIEPFAGPDINSLTILKEYFVAVLPEDHALAAKRKIVLADLAEEPFILGTSAFGGPYCRMVEELCLGAGITPSVVQDA